MEKIYLISKIHYEYNDEVYHTGNYETAYNPIKSFKDKKLAQKELEKLEFEEWKGLEISNFCYSLEEISDFSNDEIQESLNKILNQEYDVEDYVSLPKELTFDQFKELRKIFNLDFYELKELELVIDNKLELKSISLV